MMQGSGGLPAANQEAAGEAARRAENCVAELSITNGDAPFLPEVPVSMAVLGSQMLQQPLLSSQQLAALLQQQQQALLLQQQQLQEFYKRQQEQLSAQISRSWQDGSLCEVPSSGSSLTQQLLLQQHLLSVQRQSQSQGALSGGEVWREGGCDRLGGSGAAAAVGGGGAPPPNHRNGAAEPSPGGRPPLGGPARAPLSLTPAVCGGQSAPIAAAGTSGSLNGHSPPWKGSPPPRDGGKSHVLFCHGMCKWPGCEGVFKEFTQFLRHMSTEHMLDDRSAAQCRVQMQVVDQLEIKLLKERERLQAMMVHLRVGPPEQKPHHQPLNLVSTAAVCRATEPMRTPTPPPPPPTTTTAVAAAAAALLAATPPALAPSLNPGLTPAMTPLAPATLAAPLAASAYGTPLCAAGIVAAKTTAQPQPPPAPPPPPLQPPQQPLSSALPALLAQPQAGATSCPAVPPPATVVAATPGCVVTPTAGGGGGSARRKVERAASPLLPDVSKSHDFYQSTDVRPPYTYASLIRQAIVEAPDKQLTLNEIYTWFTQTFAYFRKNAATWKNAVRHNLSLHKCFVRVENVKGAVWTVDEGEFQKRRPPKLAGSVVVKSSKSGHNYSADYNGMSSYGAMDIGDQLLTGMGGSLVGHHVYEGDGDAYSMGDAHASPNRSPHDYDTDSSPDGRLCEPFPDMPMRRQNHHHQQHYHQQQHHLHQQQQRQYLQSFQRRHGDTSGSWERHGEQAVAQHLAHSARVKEEPHDDDDDDVGGGNGEDGGPPPVAMETAAAGGCGGGGGGHDREMMEQGEEEGGEGEEEETKAMTFTEEGFYDGGGGEEFAPSIMAQGASPVSH
nr:forkhead box protein P1-like isoform X2 [Petromyzon marinus]XP_032827287.1 forkhead box protein P1-like isoform X2 [Petromyzon marinus]XP_032827288.1 forkhead box protein P1-like isoform X2 [Petromyzon marinus]XP_032827289.1 forkhead box protein P1-like isoform X2 [Petromyzon marinus]